MSLTSNARSNDLGDLVALQRLDSTRFISLQSPPGTPGQAVFGGAIFALCLHAAIQTLPSSSTPSTSTSSASDYFSVYSMQGTFLSAVFSDHKVELQVDILRSTRTFFTCQVTAYQEVPGKDDDKLTRRRCMSAMVDFIHTTNQLSLNTKPAIHSVQPVGTPTPVAQIKDDVITMKERLENGTVSEPIYMIFDGIYSSSSFVELRSDPQGVMTQTSLTLDPKPTTQDHLRPSEKYSGNWLKWREDPRVSHLQSRDDGRKEDVKIFPSSMAHASACALSYILDQLIYTSAGHSDTSITEVASIVTLDFSLRFHVNDIDIFNTWAIRQTRCWTIAEDRGFCESRVWRETGRKEEPFQLIATMTQNAFIRLRKEKKGKRGASL